MSNDEAAEGSAKLEGRLRCRPKLLFFSSPKVWDGTAPVPPMQKIRIARENCRAGIPACRLRPRRQAGMLALQSLGRDSESVREQAAPVPPGYRAWVGER